MKNAEAFNSKQGICYVAEDGERKYSYQDILMIAGGSVEYATILFNGAEWQGIETLMDELIKEFNLIPLKSKVNILDLGREMDETMDDLTIGRVGIVVGYNTNQATGNTTNDPLYMVQFESQYIDGDYESGSWVWTDPNNEYYQREKLESYWKEELELV